MSSAFGLAICEKIVREMGGSMEVQSHLGAGTTVRFTAQFRTLATQPPERPHAVVHKAGCSAARPLTILVADRNMVSRRLTTVLLESNGHLVREASDCSQVLDLLSREMLDLVLLDLDTAPADAIELTRTISGAETDGLSTPVYALVTAGSTADRDAYREAGIHGFLNKPVELDAILNIIAAIALRPAPSHSVVPPYAKSTVERGREEADLSLHLV